MRHVAVLSPFSGDVEANLDYARAALRDCLFRGEAPFASHLLYPQVLDDSIETQRRWGMEAGWAWIDRSDLVAVYVDNGLSQGVCEDIQHARESQRPIVFRRLKGGDPSESEADHLMSWARDMAARNVGEG